MANFFGHPSVFNLPDHPIPRRGGPPGAPPRLPRSPLTQRSSVPGTWYTEQYRLLFTRTPQRYECVPGFTLRHYTTIFSSLVIYIIYGNAPRRADEKPVDLAFGVRPAFSLGYLVNREGAYFEKHSFRLSAARLNHIQKGKLSYRGIIFKKNV